MEPSQGMATNDDGVAAAAEDVDTRAKTRMSTRKFDQGQLPVHLLIFVSGQTRHQ
jgi:hypothetical protein